MRHFYSNKHTLLIPALLTGLWLGANAQIPQQSLSGRVNKTLPATPAPQLNDFCSGAVMSQQLQQLLGTEQTYRAQYEQNLAQVQTGLVDQRAVKVLPTVVHVIYGNSTENISDARINDFINAINQAFNQQNNQTGVRAQFQGVIGNPQVQFCLAKTDPNGQPTTGIVRKSTTLASFPQDNTQTGDAPIKKLPNGSPTWNPEKYVNIWIVDIGWLANGGGVAGYAYLPNSFSLTGSFGYLDGLVVDVNATFNQSLQGDYSIGIHELGHYLGLPHPFSNGSCNTDADGFTDTPKTNSSTPRQGNCNNTVTKCSNTVQTENFMDYAINCHKMFTLQQSAFINTVLNPTNGFRKGLFWNGCDLSAMAPVVDFNGCSGNVTPETTISFTDASSGTPTSWSWSITPATGWSFVGGTSATSQNPQVKFTGQGTYNVVLTATNANGSNSRTSSSCIRVLSGLDIDEAGFAAGLNLYPNPSTGLATLFIGNASNYTGLRVTLYNSVGVRLYQTSDNVPSEVNLDLGTYGAGIYFVEVRSNEGVATKRLVVNK